MTTLLNFPATGQIMCWGRSNYGQLGCPDPTKAHQYLWPVLKDSCGAPTKVTQIALGSEHTIALTGKKNNLNCNKFT